MFEAMAMAKPIIIGAPGEAQTLVEEAEAGISAEPENPHSYAEAIQRLMADNLLCKRFGHNGRKLVEIRFNRDILADTLETVLLSMAEEQKNR